MVILGQNSSGFSVGEPMTLLSLHSVHSSYEKKNIING